MRILVTGGTGFIGSHTVVALIAAGYQPILIDNLSNSDISVLDAITKITGSAPKFYQHDYQDQAKLAEIINTEKVEGIIHFAAFKSIGESIKQPLKYYANNVAGFVPLLELIEKLGLPMVFSSSAGVYGRPKGLPVTEDMPLELPATSPYRATKQMGEQMLADTVASSPKLKAISLRYFNPIGAHSSGLIGESPLGEPGNLIPVLMRTAAGQRDKLTIFGIDYDTPDGTCIRDYIHVMDLADAHIKALEQLAGQSGGYYDVFNIGTGHGHSVLEVINSFKQATGQKVTYEIGPRRVGDLPSVYANADKAKQILGWESKLSLEQGLQDAWRWQNHFS